MTTLAPAKTSTEAIRDELDHSRKKGALQRIVIPPCPELLARLQATMALPEPDLTEVSRIASSDVAMSAVLLRYANGPMHAAGQPVQTIGQAMNRLGLEQTASVMTGFMAQRAIRVTSVHLQRFWERAAKRAIAMTFMAHKFPGMSADVAHTYGLFCHVGLPVMAAIRLHHDLDVLGCKHTDAEVQLLVASGLLAERMMLKHEGIDPDRDWIEHAEQALKWLDLREEELEVWDLELRDMLDAA